MGAVVIKDGDHNMDFHRVREMLAKSFWVPDISFDEIIKGTKNSALVVGAFIDGQQIGYARVISDKTRFAYILDVYVSEDHRRKKIGRSMIQYILTHNELKDVYQWLLITKDAHGVYSPLGFAPVSRPFDWLEIRKQRHMVRE